MTMHTYYFTPSHDYSAESLQAQASQTPQPSSDDELLDAYAAACTELQAQKTKAGRLEQEILRRMEERGARAIPSNTYACEGTQDNTYDQASLTPLKEVLNEADLTTVLTTGYQKVVWVPEKWATQKVLALARRLPEVQAIVDRARIEGRLKLKFQKREQGIQ